MFPEEIVTLLHCEPGLQWVPATTWEQQHEIVGQQAEGGVDEIEAAVAEGAQQPGDELRPWGYCEG